MKIQTSSLNQSEETLDKHTVQVIFNQHIMLKYFNSMFSHYCAQVWDYQTVRLSNCRTLLRTQNLIDIPVHTGETEREREKILC